MAALAAASPGLSQTAAPQAGAPAVIELTARERRDIYRIERYLTQMTTLKSRFIQQSSTGRLARGTLYVSRPGRMRFEYDPPSPLLLVANGTFLIYKDTQLDQVTHIPLSQTPLSVLADPKIDLGRKLEVLGLWRRDGRLGIRLRLRDEPESGTLALLFNNAPLALREWTVTDAMDVSVRVSLLEPVTGLDLDPSLFEVPVDLFEDQDTDR